MAEKQLAYRASGNDELFADDDPLAELARIVGFDTRPTPPVAEPVIARQEPAFDLEDELLREFERYDAPRVRPVDDVAVAPAREPSHDEAYVGPVSDDAVVDREPVYHSDAPHHEEPVFTDFDPAAYEAATRPLSDAEPFAEEADWQMQEDFAPAEPAEVEAWPEPVADVPALDTRDLADELEMSIAPVVPPAPAAKVPQWAAANIKLPLANFNTARRIEPVEAAPAEVAPSHAVVDTEHEFDESPALGFPAEQDRHEFSTDDVSYADDHHAAAEPVEPLFDLAAAAKGDVHPDAALTEPAYEDVPEASSFEFDDLLADVSRYPVPQRLSELEPEPEIEPETESSVHDAFHPVAEFAAEPETPPQPAGFAFSRQEAQATAVPDADDPFAGHDFELDLEGIELELAELDFTESKAVSSAAKAPAAMPSAPVVTAAAIAAAQSIRPELATRAAPATVAPVLAPVAQAVRPEMAVRAAPAAVAPVIAAVAPVVAAAQAVRPEMATRAAPAAVAPPTPVPEPDQALPFDPSEISDTGERVETFEGMHVPALPHVDHEEPVALQPEYDFDIDAEMANLFEAPPKSAATTSTAVSQPQATSSAPTTPRYTAPKDAPLSQPGGELDEFERALEEDFRRSVSETSVPSATAARMTFESSSITADRRRAGSMRAIAAGVVAVAILGSGVYAASGWLSRGGSSLGLASSGQPRVITADKDPVKVVPEDPGGKVVPNQDKAVYDRVAGDPTPAPKQKALVSSSEQPVDVVQRTLVPEAESADDGDGGNVQDTSSTPVGETEDPRLLPNQATAANGNDSNASPTDPSAMAPRRVKTMIVKSDGTLVARDDTAATAPDTSTKTATAAAKPGVAAASPANNQVASAELKPTVPDSSAAASSLSEDANAPSADSTPIRVVKTTKVGDTKPAGDATSTAPATPPAAAAAAAAPVPAVRPVKPAAPAPAAPAATHAQPTQVASASPATQPAKAAPAASAGVGGYVMQIASLPSEEEAKRSQANLSSKFASVIGGHPIEVKKFDIAGKGTYYRVRVVAGSKDDAAALCVRYRQAGGSCLISK